MPRNHPQSGPPYRPDFYVRENIIGYTGALHESPTVYFKSDKEFGHITQAHGKRDNVGREVVGNAKEKMNGHHYKYVIHNIVDKDGNEVSVEEYVHARTGNTSHIHTSRTKFTDISRVGIKAFDILTQSIWQHPSLKKKWAFLSQYGM